MKDIWIVAGVLVLGLIYGYWVGSVGKRRGWPGQKIKWVAGGPLIAAGLVMQVISIVSKEVSGYASAQEWAKFPWMMIWTSGFFAMILAAKGAKMTMSDLEKKDNLSIR